MTMIYEGWFGSAASSIKLHSSGNDASGPHAFL